MTTYRGTMHDGSQRSVILEAARGLAQPFTPEALVVAAWERQKETFGLRGHKDRFPDSNRVMTSVYGRKGLVRTGRLVRDGTRLRGAAEPEARDGTNGKRS